MPSERRPHEGEGRFAHARRVLRLATAAAAAALSPDRALYCLWEITYRCNARCAMCALWRRPAHAAEELDLGEMGAILGRLWSHGCRAVNFSGGEPTLRGDLEALVRLAARRGFWTSMVTNGFGLSRTRVADLRRAGLDSLLVSVDAADPASHDQRRGLPGSHAQALRCLRWIGEDFLFGHRRGGMMVVLTRDNLSDLGRLANLAHSLGVGMAVQPYHPKKTDAQGGLRPLGSGDLAILRKAGREPGLLLSSRRYIASLADPAGAAGTPCRAGRAYFSIDPFGGLHPCVDQPAVGHALRDDFALLRSAAARRCLAECRGCWYSFRGETDLALTVAGYLDKLGLALGGCHRQQRVKRPTATAPCPEAAAAERAQTGGLQCDEA